jgi:hypothetical protein
VNNRRFLKNSLFEDVLVATVLAAIAAAATRSSAFRFFSSMLDRDLVTPCVTV